MTSLKFDKIKVKLQAHNPIYAKYKNDTTNRELCPHVLGYKKENSSETDPNERVLCYQLSGPDPAQGWRFFDLTFLEIDNSAPPPGNWVTPPNYDWKWQNSVKKIKHKV
jgi:hypothetical protein